MSPSPKRGQRPAAPGFRDPEASRWLQELVALAPTNLEDTAHDRYEKPHYASVAEWLARWAALHGLPCEKYDPVHDGPAPASLRGIPRPNLQISLDRNGSETVLVMAHFDVVPVPEEQLDRWKSPPHTLTQRRDGRLYGRGANDDLGCGVVAGLLALHRLKKATTLRRNVRLVVCCDEETGGEGGIEAVKARDATRSPEERWLRADVALIPDGSPHVTVGSSGVAFLDAGFSRAVALRSVLEYGTRLVALHDDVRKKRSIYRSPDWPEFSAPDPVLTGRATVTQFDLTAEAGGTVPRLALAHAESAATNQIARSVTLGFAGSPGALNRLRRTLRAEIRPPFRLAAPRRSGVEIPKGVLAIAVVGQSAHGGYPHAGHNPVPATFTLLSAAIAAGDLDGDAATNATYGIDLRLIPEAPLEAELQEVLGSIRRWIPSHAPHASIEAPRPRARSGYALPVEHPAAIRLEAIVRETLGQPGIFGEYGGTDASALSDLRTPTGSPLPALVFGSMDRSAHVHEAEESADPRLIEGVAETICRFVQEP